MSDKKISQLTASTTPLAGAEVLPIVQSGTTKQVSVANLTAGRDVAVNILDATSSLQTGSVAQNETHQYMLSNWDTANEFSARFTADYFGKIRMSTAVVATGSNPALGSYTEQFELQSGNLKLPIGNLVIGTAGKGIDFSADGQAAGMTSELLDDYEEGTWTPVLATSAVNFASVTYDAAVYGLYTKIGNVVHIQGMMRTDAVDATGATGLPIISGLPFTSSSGGGFRDVALSITRVEGFVINNPSSAVVNENSVNIFPVYRSTANGIDAYLPLASIGTGADNNIMYFSGTYTAA